MEPQGSEQIANNWLAGLERLKAKHNLIGDVRSKGLLLGIELVNNLSSASLVKNSESAHAHPKLDAIHAAEEVRPIVGWVEQPG